MFELILENKDGDRLIFDQQSPFTVTEIQGLNPAPALVNTNEVALLDGARYNSAKLQMRQINVAFAIEIDPARNRLEVYKVLQPKHPVKLYYYGDYRKVWIEGYITAVDITFWDMKQIVTCSIICPDPYLRDITSSAYEGDTVIDMFSFPFESTDTPQLVFGDISSNTDIITANDGDVTTGMIITITADGDAGAPTIYNVDTEESFYVSRPMVNGEVMTIDTRRGHRSVTMTDSHGQEINLINYLGENSTWLQVPVGGATFGYTASVDVNHMKVSIQVENLYEGV